MPVSDHARWYLCTDSNGLYTPRHWRGGTPEPPGIYFWRETVEEVEREADRRNAAALADAAPVDDKTLPLFPEEP